MTTVIDQADSPANKHACLIQLDGKGVLITGRSGSGKTSLSLGLIEVFEQKNRPANFVSDDQVLLTVKGDKLSGSAPRSIAGKVEIFGFGITKIKAIEKTDIHLIVTIDKQDKIERMPKEKIESLMGVEIPAISVPEQHENHSKRIVCAKLAALFD